jgi:hypothetical protein
MPSALMKWPISKDAEGGRDDPQDLLRVGNVRTWEGFTIRLRFDCHVREHEPARRSDGAVSFRWACVSQKQ